jgi:hypothetical protein
MSSIKALLGVRVSTPNDLCLIESGYTTAAGTIRHIQRKLFENMLNNTEGREQDPFKKVWDMCEEANTPCVQYVKELLLQSDPISTEMEKIKDRVNHSEGTKAVTYGSVINPDLKMSAVYTPQSHLVPEHHRTAFTQLRLSSHNLAIETGWWARVPRERRTCRCGQIQTEEHMIADCVYTSDIRSGASNMESFKFPDFFATKYLNVMCNVCYKVLHQ